MCLDRTCQRSNIAAVAAVTIGTKGMSRLGWKTGRSRWRCRRHPSPSMVVRLSPKSGLTRAAVAFLPICAMVILQHVLDVVGMTEEIRAAEAESHGDDVAILARAVNEKPQRVLPSHWEYAQEREPGRPGWDLGGTASQAAPQRHYLTLAVEPVPSYGDCQTISHVPRVRRRAVRRHNRARRTTPRRP